MSLSKVPTCPEKLCVSLRALKSPWHILGGKCVSQGSANTQPFEESPFPEISPDIWEAVQGQPRRTLDLEKEHCLGGPGRRMLHWHRCLVDIDEDLISSQRAPGRAWCRTSVLSQQPKEAVVHTPSLQKDLAHWSREAGGGSWAYMDHSRVTRLCGLICEFGRHPTSPVIVKSTHAIRKHTPVLETQPLKHSSILWILQMSPLGQRCLVSK